jgi:hypothetical protein
MTITTVTATAPTATARRVGFGQVMLAEWTKIRSVRSTIWALILLIVLDLSFTALFAWLNTILLLVATILLKRRDA